MSPLLVQSLGVANTDSLGGTSTATAQPRSVEASVAIGARHAQARAAAAAASAHQIRKTAEQHRKIPPGGADDTPVANNDDQANPPPNAAGRYHRVA
jgi:hypothetical protein